MQQAWRPGPEVVQARTARGAMLYDASRSGNFTESRFELPWWIEHGSIESEVSGGRGATLFVSAEGRNYALRHYRRGGLPGRLLRDSYLFLGSARTRPIREWRLIYTLHRAGLPVPAPIAARWVRGGLGFGYTGDLLTERIAGARTLGARLLEGALSLADWVAVGRCIRRFHDVGLCHADLNAHNLLFDARGEVYMIDFDRCRLRPPGLWSDANLVRLRRSLLKITDPLPERHFDETDWHTLLAAYADAPREALALGARRS